MLAIALIGLPVEAAACLAAVFGLISDVDASGVTSAISGVVGCVAGGLLVRATFRRWQRAYRSRYPAADPHERSLGGWQEPVAGLLFGLPWYATLVAVSILLFAHSPVALVLSAVALLIATRWFEAAFLARAAGAVTRVKRRFWLARIKATLFLAAFAACLVVAARSSYYAAAMMAVSAAIWVVSARWMNGVRDRHQRQGEANSR